MIPLHIYEGQKLLLYVIKILCVSQSQNYLQEIYSIQSIDYIVTFNVYKT